jgi:TonB family protein
MTRLRTATAVVSLVFVATLCRAAAVVPPAEPSSGEEIATYYELLVGKPEAEVGAEPSVTVVPGTVVLTEPESTTFSRDLGLLREKLAETYGLGPVQSVAAARVMLRPGETKDLPTPFAELGIELRLIQWNADAATYRVHLEEQGKVLAEPTVAVRVGGRGVVATRDGDRAPYAFVVLAPRLVSLQKPEGPLSAPRLVEKVLPIYPEAARAGKVQGIVLLDCIIGKDGRVMRIDVAQAQPDGLTEAAIEAVRQWRYEPARNEKGEPVEVKMTVTINFRLE